MPRFEVGDIVLDIEGKQSDKPLFGMITKFRVIPTHECTQLSSYYVDWFVDENDKMRYANYMYEDEIKKV